MIRLSAYLADSGICSRRAAEKLITAETVRVNEKLVTNLATKVEPGSDLIEVKDQSIWRIVKPISEKEVYALYKPLGFDSTCHDPHAKHTVLDLVKVRSRIYPIGRLDRQTSGLLLLTNDGQLAHHLTNPGFKLSKTYKVVCQIPDHYQIKLLKTNLKKLENGVTLDNQRTAPAKIRMIGQISTDRTILLEIIITEGRNKQVRRMVQKIGLEVKTLTRVAVGKLSLEQLSLRPGQFVKLDDNMLAQLA